MPSGFRERLRQKPNTREMQRDPSKLSGLQRLLVVLEGKPFEGTLAQPSLGAGQPAEAGQVVLNFLMGFSSLSRSGSPGGHRGEGLCR